jgi:peptidoglycan/xylan/chitin deacetylase (PgdA/CDA1 family)
MKEKFEEPALPILLYHKCPPNLESHFEIIRNHGYSTVHLTEVEGYFERPDKLPQDRLALTFDDALLDFFDVAIPLLQRFDFSATVCVPTGRVSPSSGQRNLDNWENNRDSRNPIMTWEEIRELNSLTKADGTRLIEFAAHSVSHTNLNNLEAAKETLLHEISASKAELQNQLGIQDPIFFCFPYGGGEGKFTDLLRKTGYAGALMVTGEKWSTYRIPRHAPEDDEAKLVNWLNKQREIAQKFNAG